MESDKETLIQLVAKSYEDASAEFIQEAIKQKALPYFEQLGRWWDKNTEIDLVGLNKTDNSILFVETKWNTKPLGADVLEDLKRKAQKVEWGRPGRKEYFALITKAGFEKKLMERSKSEGVVLIKEDHMYSSSTKTVQVEIHR